MSEYLTFDNLREANVGRSEQWQGYKMDESAKLSDCLFRATELAGETGELCNIIKKVERWRQSMAGGLRLSDALPMIADGIADVMISADRVADAFGIDMDLAIREKFNKTSKKYGLSKTL